MPPRTRRLANPRTRERFRVSNDKAARKVVYDLDKAPLDSAANTLHTDRHHRPSTLLAKAVRDAHARFVVRPIRIIARGDLRRLVKGIRHVEGIEGLDKGLK